MMKIKPNFCSNFSLQLVLQYLEGVNLQNMPIKDEIKNENKEVLINIDNIEVNNTTNVQVNINIDNYVEEQVDQKNDESVPEDENNPSITFGQIDRSEESNEEIENITLDVEALRL